MYTHITIAFANNNISICMRLSYADQNKKRLKLIFWTGFRNLEMSYYGSSVPCYDPYYDILDTFTYILNQRRQSNFVIPTEKTKDAYKVVVQPSSSEDITVQGPGQSKEVSRC